MIELLSVALRLLLVGAITLLLVATWQRTRIGGFLLLAASHVVGLLVGWVLTLMFRWGGMDADGMAWLVHLLPLAGLLLAAAGCWQVYQALKPGTPRAPGTG